MRMRPGDVQKLFYGGLLKPREFLERKKQLFIGQEQPESVLRDVGDFNSRNVLAKRRGFHSHVSR